jgi:phosphoglycolate phosphatase
LSATHPAQALPRWSPAPDLHAAIVDLDGTMLDTAGDFAAALQLMLMDLLLPPVTRAFVLTAVGKGTEHLIGRTLVHLGAPSSLHSRATQRYLHHYETINGQHADVFEGVLEGLTALRQRGWKLACLTNKPGAFAQPLLQAKGLLPFFECVFGGDAFARKKPDPLPVWEVCKALRTRPARTLMIGDSSNDADAARAAGCPVVLLRHGYNHGLPVETCAPDAALDHLGQLEALLPPR